jgi:hypothetical protein
MSSSRNNPNWRLAVLGGNGQIGIDVARTWAVRNLGQVHLFSRRSDETEAAFRVWVPDEIDSGWDSCHYDSFFSQEYDIIVNAVGNGRLSQMAGHAETFSSVSLFYDDLCRDYLSAHPQTLCAFISSGLVYGSSATWPVEDAVPDLSKLDASSPARIYQGIKREIEARHHAHDNLNFYDLRVFGWFSRHMALKDSFFLSEVATAWIDGTQFRTGSEDMLRDYISGTELVDMLCGLLAYRPSPGGFNLCSLAPTTKWDLLSALIEQGLEVITSESPQRFLGRRTSPSNLYSARNVGFVPKRSSFEIVFSELNHLRNASRSGYARRIV